MDFAGLYILECARVDFRKPVEAIQLNTIMCVPVKISYGRLFYQILRGFYKVLKNIPFQRSMRLLRVFIISNPCI